MSVVGDRIRACLEKHPDWSDARVASAIRGATARLTRTIREGLPEADSPSEDLIQLTPVERKSSVPSGGVISLDLVRKRFDTVSAIEHELSKIPPGKLVSERELCLRTAGKDNSRFRRTVENNAERFRNNRIRLKIDPDSHDAVWYWGAAADIAEALRLRDE